MEYSRKEYRDHQIVVSYDEFAESPISWDNIGKFVAFGRNVIQPHYFEGIKHFEAYAKRDGYIVLPLFKYEHGGVAFSTKSFMGRAPHANWDSQQIGWVYAERHAVHSWFGCKYITAKVIAKTEEALRSMVTAYGSWANGEMLRVDVTFPDDSIESFDGFTDEGEAYQYAQEWVDSTLPVVV